MITRQWRPTDFLTVGEEANQLGKGVYYMPVITVDIGQMPHLSIYTASCLKTLLPKILPPILRN